MSRCCPATPVVPEGPAPSASREPWELADIRSSTGLTAGFRIGGVALPNSLILAPMAGVADGPFRAVCARLGAGLTVSELANARALTLGSAPTVALTRFLGQPRPFAVQIFGADPDTMARAAALVEASGVCDLIDINMGCPVSKVVKTGAGAAMMKNPRLAGEVITAVRRAVSLPVTVKFRLGWSANQITVRDFTRMVLDRGVAAVAVHARTKEAGYTGRAQWELLAGLGAECGEVPFIANGDLATPEDLATVQKISGCRGFMVGRAAIGRPWVFAELLGRPLPDDGALRFRIFRWHLREMLMEHGAKGVALFRVHLFAYLRHHPGASQLRRRMCNERDPVVVQEAGRAFFAGRSPLPPAF
ncbi:MAG: tRNA dihydrouridine synthase B [Candidatus Ozemobacter sibiricus]|uniref:tRNA-dihydrouridine synthase n=1 Tax=Candidatus Ozemobacter sibiricus TaxID=2268124 RepID=A0A367ZB04_9BACT|nr:MAG: tRNA dihydrouridine synthase B [Candidatus Ozemobacter sibiricus]